MSKRDWTEGPWHVSGEIAARYLRGIGDVILVRRNAERDDRYVAITTLDGMGENGPETPPSEQAANARLIAAAPALYEALEEALHAIDGLTDKGDAMTRGLAALAAANPKPGA